MRKVVSFLESTGMWLPENRAKYDFLLSPDVFPVRKNWEDQLAEFARTLQSHFLQQVGAFPTLCKVDIMIDRDDNLKVAEVDGLNKRALGYAILQRKIAILFGQNPDRFFPGNEHVLKDILGDKTLFVVVPGREKYYRFGFDILTEALRDLGVKATWGHERTSVKFLQAANQESVVLLDCPKSGHVELDSLLTSGCWEALIPNHQIFSSKENLVGMESHLIPKTLAVDAVGKLPVVPFEKFVLKTTNQSGSKGIFFWDELPQEIPPGRYVVQEIVEGREFGFSYFDKNGNLVATPGWQVRLIVTLDLLRGRVVDVDVTACKGRLVHGMAESIQIAGVRE